MTTQTLSLRIESEPRSTTFSPPPESTTEQRVAKVYELVIPESTAAIPSSFTRIGDYVAELESRPEEAEHVRDARAALAVELKSSGPSTLRSMRLALGLSQAQLAAKIGTSQSQIARIESGIHDPTYDTFGRLARALQASITEVVSAFGEGRTAAEVRLSR